MTDQEIRAKALDIAEHSMQLAYYSGGGGVGDRSPYIAKPIPELLNRAEVFASYIRDGKVPETNVLIEKLKAVLCGDSAK